MSDNSIPQADRSITKDEAPLAPRQAEPAPATPRLADAGDETEIPVPIVMSPAEIDERAQAVEAVRDNRDLEPRTEV